MSSWNLGLLGAAAGVVPGNAYEFITTTTLPSNTNAVSFGSLNTYSGTYQHLQIRFLFRQISNDTSLMARMNDDSNGGNYYGYWQNSGGGNSAEISTRVDTNSLIFFYSQDFAGAPSGSFYTGVIDILDPFETSKNTTIRCLLGATGKNDKIGLASGVWLSTAALTSFALSVGTGNPAPWQGSSFETNSKFSLYGLRGA
jgi:hypothetical protein